MLAHLDHPRGSGLNKLNYQNPMDSRLIEMLACPVSKAPVFFSEARQLIVCPTSKLAYPIKDGIPAMLPEDAIKLEDSDPLLTQSRADLRGRSGLRGARRLAVLVELEQLALHAVEIVEARELAQIAGFAP